MTSNKTSLNNAFFEYDSAGHTFQGSFLLQRLVVRIQPSHLGDSYKGRETRLSLVVMETKQNGD